MLLSNAELKEKVDIHQEPKLRKWLNANRVQWMKDGKDRAITTLSAIEKVLFKESENEVDF